MNIENVSKYLPIQNPLYSFLHNNALQVFEEHSFFDGIYLAAHLYEGRTLPSGPEYREWYAKGIIKSEALNKVVDHYIHVTGCRVSKKDVLLILFTPIKYVIPDWRVRKLSPSFFWEKNYSVDFKKKINSWVIPWIQSYLDQGQSIVANPYTQLGLIPYFLDSIENQPKYLRGFTEKAYHLISSTREMTPEERLKSLLLKTGYPESQFENLLKEICFQIKGWSGMVNRLSLDPEQRIISQLELNLQDWCSILLSLQLALHESLCIEHGIPVTQFSEVAYNPSELKYEQGARILKECKEVGIKIEDENSFLDWFETFNNRDRYQIWQIALEESLISESHRLIEKGLAESKNKNDRNKAAPEAMFMFCIDDREESIRRHLESLNNQYKTSGVVGFFGLDMKFKSVTHPKATNQCPPVVTPQFSFEEYLKEKNNFYNFFQYYHILTTTMYRATRTYLRGLLVSASIGPLTLLNMALRLFRPQIAFKLTKKFKDKLIPKEHVHFKSDFDLNSKVERVKLICQMAGLFEEKDFPPFIYVVGHKSTTTNNPFRQAYGCGACSGNSGAPNSLLFSTFANDLEVRHELKKRGYSIPDNTQFIPLIHDTCSDEIELLDSKFFESPNSQTIKKHLNDLKLAAKKNAKERLKTLMPGAQISEEKAYRLAFRRSMDLAQPRPEYGHSGVRLAVFGPRRWTQNLNLDRRAFLISYDSTQDPDHSILKEVLIGALPVCANIGLDYFFSKADPQELGAGSKLPLNVTGLLGVMTGAESDLRIGLAEQMVDIHIPTRMIIYIDSSPEILRPIFESHPRLNKLVHNKWVHIFCIDFKTYTITRYP
jgi:uncharacterized protein YbcC (UPF0753/DUF2309 family)